MIEEIEAIISEIDKVINHSASSEVCYGPAVLELLPDIRTGFEYIQNCLINDPPDIYHARKGVSGLGRVTLEYSGFYESDLGKRVLELNNKLRKELDRLSENFADKEGYSKLREFE